MKEHCRGYFISHDSVRCILRRRLPKFPRTLHYVAIKELEQLKLIKKIGNTISLKYELIGRDADKLLNQHISVI